MNQESIHVIGAALLYFVFSWAYYMATGRAWMAAWGLTRKQIDRKDPTPFLVAFIGCLWTSYGLFTLLKNIHPKSLLEVETVALGTWLFIVCGTALKHYVFAGVKFKAFVLDFFGDAIGFLLAGYILWKPGLY